MSTLPEKLSKMPVSLSIILVWIIVWILVACSKNTLSMLAGKGLAKIDGHYYRFFTAGLVHKHPVHLIANVCAMFWIGFLYESRVGSLKFLAVGVICAVLCEIIIAAIYRNATECIGGSPYNYALLGFGLTMQLMIPGFPKFALGTWSGNWLLVYCIASNIPVSISILPFVDIATVITHLIAFVLGAAAAFLCWLLGMR